MNICIVQTQKDACSETFLKAHADYLQGRIDVLYGGLFPLFRMDGSPLLSLASFPRRIMRKIQRVILRRHPDYHIKKAFRNFIKQRSIDVVLAEYGPVGVAVMDVCRDVSVPLVVHFHGADAYDSQWLLQTGRRYPELFQQVAAIVVVSHAMEQQLLRLGAPREKLWYNPYGVDVNIVKASRPDMVPPRFLAVGRLVDKKAPLLTLLAFRDVWNIVPEAHLTVVGDGPLAEACCRMTTALGLQGAVEWMGARKHHEVLELMQASRAFIQHSVCTKSGDSEGMPVSVLEAQASGLPVVATRHAGIPDVVIDEKTGFLVDENDVAGMSACMLRLASDPILAGQMGMAGRKRIEEEFSMSKSIAGLQAILATAVTEQGVGRKKLDSLL